MTDDSPPRIRSLGGSAPSPIKRRRRGWIWFFVVLLILTIIATAIPIWYNTKSQLTFEKLAEARAQWNAIGPANYDMEYTIRRPDSLETYDVKVRDRKVVAVTRNGQAVIERLYQYS